MRQSKWRMMDSCDMQIYMSCSWEVNTWAMPSCWHFNFGTYILACHTRHHASFVYCRSVSVRRHWTSMKKFFNYMCTLLFINEWFTALIWSHLCLLVAPREISHPREEIASRIDVARFGVRYDFTVALYTVRHAYRIWCSFICTCQVRATTEWCDWCIHHSR